MNLQRLFQNQIDEEYSSMLYFVIKEGDRECLQRYKYDDIDAAIKYLSDCVYVDTRIGIPKFERKVKKNVSKTTRKVRS